MVFLAEYNAIGKVEEDIVAGRFRLETAEKLKYYVYRLIDPRNGQTFYVGKGKGDRVFQHADGVMEDMTEEEVDQNSDKIKRIAQIKNDGFKVAHIIHRHGLDESTAFEVEAALIDAYPEVLNEISGHYADRGVMHAKQVIEKYEAKEIQEEDIKRYKLLLININRTAGEEEAYDAVRYAWRINVDRAREADYVLAIQQGLVKGVFIAEKWMKATTRNFPGKEGVSKRWGFEGKEAPDEIKKLFHRRRLPDGMKRKKGEASPVRYFYDRG